MMLLKLTEDLWINPEHVSYVLFRPETECTDGQKRPYFKVVMKDKDFHSFTGNDAIRVRELFRPVLCTSLMQRVGS